MIRLTQLSTTLAIGVLMALWPATLMAATGEGTEAAAGSSADVAAAAPLPDDGPMYMISGLELEYLKPNTAAPAIAELMALPVTLTLTSQGFVGPRPGVQGITRTLSELSFKTEACPYYASALQAILDAVRNELSARKYLGIYVAPDPMQITEGGQDLRQAGETGLTILIAMGNVTQVRSLAHGERIDPEQRVNHPLHERIVQRSPIQPYAEPAAVRSDLIRKDFLDDYTLFLSRHPGRRVDVALSAAPEIGSVNLDYLITETKPWLVYGQISNTGTENTDCLREQFGFRNYQFTNQDDIFAVDYVTANFDSVHAIVGSYEARIGDADRARWRIFGGWNEYTASDVGIAADTFEGVSWHGGGELIFNVYQDGPLFLDVIPGARYESIEVQDTITPGWRGEDFLLWYVTLRAERLSDWSAFRSSLTYEWQCADITDVQNVDLGRGGTNDSWGILRGDISQSFYLEPLLDLEAWQDPSTPESSTLSHEMYFSARGQYAFEHRLVPHFEMLAGGLYTVRGYRESVAAGDNGVVATAEYRFHVPKAAALEAEPRMVNGQPFRFAPQQVYGPTDWDWMLKAFLDTGVVYSNGAAGDPSDVEVLIGTGVGTELQIKRNVTARLDWGIALKDVEGATSAGSQRLHFVVTVLY